MKQVLIAKGQAFVEDVPAPQIEPGKVLVKVIYSCISAGTEISSVRNSGISLWKKALQQPEKVKKVFKMVSEQGIMKTRYRIESKLSKGAPTGYSTAGVVLEVGAGIKDLRPGDRVACAGNQCAFHAGCICVPRNLVVRIPDKLDFEEASTVALGAIAMQGIRRANPSLGETFVVIGLGILGQLVVQFLKVNGCHVVGLEINRQRMDLAMSMGLDFGIHPENGLDIEQIARLTDGHGADGVIITANTPSDEVVSTAFKMCRKKGRVVLVGYVGLHLNWEDFYQKELDLFISSSYGPGRYDTNYEEKGKEYPIGYVRWTENRNMSAYLRLLAEEKIQIKSLIEKVYPIDQAHEAYECLKNERNKPMIVLLSYPKEDHNGNEKKIFHHRAEGNGQGRINFALAGAGSFAKEMHLPNLKALSDVYHLRAVMSRTGHNAKSVADQFGAEYSTTDYQELLNDPKVDLIIITTRHNLHANMTFQALTARKNVLVEKPLTVTKEELDRVKNFYENLSTNESAPILLTGFNRRFSRYAQAIYQLTSQRTNPLIINYRMNAGYIPLDNWVHNEEGGGRNIGEACHIYDLFTFLTNSKVIGIIAYPIVPTTAYYSSQDNFVATMHFADGSVATLTYTSLGAKDYPKEQMEVFFDGKTIVIDDYKRLSAYGVNIRNLQTRNSQKGQQEEIEVLANVLKNGGEWPIPLWQQVQAMEISFAVEKQINWKSDGMVTKNDRSTPDA